MSSEKPPSIAPRRPAGAPERTSATIGRVSMPGSAPTAPPSTPASGPSVGAPAGTPAGSPLGGPVPEAPASVSFSDRLKKATGSPRGSSTKVELDDEPGTEAGPRRVRLSVARIDPWSVMKLSFLLSVAIGIMIVIAAAVIWQTLDNMAVFSQVNELIGTLLNQPDYDTVLNIASFERVISVATMVAVVDVILLTALSTIMAFLYNIVAALVGGLHLTLTDD